MEAFSTLMVILIITGIKSESSVPDSEAFKMRKRLVTFCINKKARGVNITSYSYFKNEEFYGLFGMFSQYEW